MDQSFLRHRQVWERNAALNAPWAILSDPQRLRTGWDDGEFFATGRKDMELILATLAGLNLEPRLGGRALDFGCGIGRLTRAMAERFTGAWGVDVSKSMIAQAADRHRDKPNCRFLHNEDPDLRKLPDSHFDFVLSLLVFQHIPPPHNDRFLAEVLRALTPGGTAVIQLASQARPTWKSRLKWHSPI